MSGTAMRIAEGGLACNFIAYLRYATASCCVVASGCGGPMDVGQDQRAALPVGSDNPVILLNDSVYDNWHGEYALLLAHEGGPRVIGTIVSTGGMWFDLDANYAGWQELTQRARDSGLQVTGEPIRSPSEQLARPEDDAIEATSPNDSAGARFIVDESLRVFATTSTPVVIAVGGRLTDVADAYLIDPNVVERVIIVASVGSGFGDDGTTAEVGRPNGEMDPWAGEIVSRKFRYIQIAAHYDQASDISAARVDDLPSTPMGQWIASKTSQIDSDPLASDQVSVLVPGLEAFVQEFSSVSPGGFVGKVPTLRADPLGKSYLVTAVDGVAARERLWQLLLNMQ